MKAALLIHVVVACAILGVFTPIIAGQEAEKLYTIRKITPVSDAIPVAITTIQCSDSDDAKIETQTITRGIRIKYGYELEFHGNRLSLRLANDYYEKWFLSIGLNDSDPNEQRYGMWLADMPAGVEFNEKDFILYIFNPKEQYLLVQSQSGFGVKNILAPVDKVAMLEEGLNSVRAPVVGGVFLFHGAHPEIETRHLGYEILHAETDSDARNVKVVSFTKEKDGEFCIEVESPKSKSIFTFVTDREITLEILKEYNNRNKTDHKEPPPERRYWKMVGYTTPPGTTIEKPFRTWRLLSIEDEVVTEYRAKFVSRDGKNVVLEKEDGQTITVDWSKMFESDRQIINMYLEAEKSPETETSNPLTSTESK